MQPRPATDLALRQTLDEVQPTDLGPLLHPDHLGPPELAPRRRAQAPRATGRTLKWPTFHSTQVDQFSPGADTELVDRRPLTSSTCALVCGCVARWSPSLASGSRASRR